MDGWELNGQLFPNEQDHPKPIYDRFFEICGFKKPKQVFKSSQNAALIQFRVPRRGNGFSFYVTFVENPTRTYLTIIIFKFVCNIFVFCSCFVLLYFFNDFIKLKLLNK